MAYKDGNSKDSIFNTSYEISSKDTMTAVMIITITLLP